MSRQWSAEQTAIFDHVRDSSANLLVRARAGTGKSTTMVEALRYSKASRAVMCAFNKRIARDLEQKVPSGTAEVKTLHGIGYGVVRQYWNGVTVDAQRSHDLARQALGMDAPDPMVDKCAKLASLGKGTGLTPNNTDLFDTMLELAVSFDLEPDEEWSDAGWTTTRLAKGAIEAMSLARVRESMPRIDFDDMVYLPIANNWARPRYDLVVVDEAQDMNAIQHELALRIAMPSGKIIVVGDDRQAIYGFRGADSDALDRLKGELHADELGLTTTYRCGRAIVELARVLVPDFRAHESNYPGEVTTLPRGMDPLVLAAEPGDFVLSRKNAPLATVCLRLLKAGKSARIEGKDIGAQLAGIIRKWNKPITNGEALLNRIEFWRDRKVMKLQSSNKPEAAAVRIATIKDQAELLTALAEGLNSSAELLVRIESLFSDSETSRRPAVVCSSIHKAKGLEADRVFVLRDTLYPNRKRLVNGSAMPDPIEEKNLEYVAITRAKKALVWCDGTDK